MPSAGSCRQCLRPYILSMFICNTVHDDARPWGAYIVIQCLPAFPAHRRHRKSAFGPHALSILHALQLILEAGVSSSRSNRDRGASHCFLSRRKRHIPNPRKSCGPSFLSQGCIVFERRECLRGLGPAVSRWSL